MKFTKELKEYMMPLGTLSENDIIDFEKKVKDMPFSLKEILKDKNIDTLIFDKGFVSYTYKNEECTVYAYYVSKESKVDSKEHRKAFYECLKKNGCKRLKAFTTLPPKVFRSWGFKPYRYEIVKDL
jgi:hypothetical protein